MRFLFVIQGEGRGHMTQAVSLKNILEAKGHSVEKIIIGTSQGRVIPEFIRQEFGGREVAIPSPNFALDKRGRKVRLLKTIAVNLMHLPRFVSSVWRVKELIKVVKPDMVVNFYDLLAGLTFYFYRFQIPFVCVGHQYLTLHPDFPFPRGNGFQRFLLKWHTRLTALRAHKLLALSFRYMDTKPGSRLIVVPPLLRKMVMDKSPEKGDFFLGYLLNKAYADEVVNWHKKYPTEKAHFFWDNQEAEEETIIHRNLIFHRLSDTKFVDFMSRCKGVVTTAGFESVCEAMYLGKPVLMVPTYGHYEQQCNATDAIMAGAGIQAKNFAIERLADYVPHYRSDQKKIQHWVDSACKQFVFHLTESRVYTPEVFTSNSLLSQASKGAPVES